MIRQLLIQDFALIDQLEVQFDRGLSVLTGQTGAGKSIILGALNMVLGERADPDLIRKGAQKAIVEVVIEMGHTPALNQLFQAHELEHRDPIVILRRELKDYGSRAFINDQPVSNGLLRQVGDLLVDLHGQHEHQLLLKEEQHRVFLDRFAQHGDVLAGYSKARKEALRIDKELQELRFKERDLKERAELNRFKLKELEDAALKEGELDELHQQLYRLEHAEDLASHTAAVIEIGADQNGNVSELLQHMIRELEALADILPEASGYRDELEAAKVSVTEAVRFAMQYRDGIDFNPQLLERLRRRESEITKLQKKHGTDFNGLIALRESVRQQIEASESFEFTIETLETSYQQVFDQLKNAYQALRDHRIKAGEQLAQKLIEELSQLGMIHVRFAVLIDDEHTDPNTLRNYSDHGLGNIRFLISTNKGEELKPLAKIASGGEISRVMLGLKTVLALDDEMPVMIFDEIDTGISGQVSEMVGRAMKKLSHHCQIIAITHQAPIAALAEHHYRVEKIEEGDRTLTHIVKLTDDDRVREIAGLMSGSTIGDAALESARQLLLSGK